MARLLSDLTLAKPTGGRRIEYFLLPWGILWPCFPGKVAQDASRPEGQTEVYASGSAVWSEPASDRAANR
jgi:hypothetical protein